MNKHLLSETAAAMPLLLFIGCLDYLTGAELGFFLFYYVPLGLIGWNSGRTKGLIYSIIASLIWIGADHLADHIYTSEFARWWNIFIRLASFLLVAFLFAKLRNRFDREKELNSELSRALAEVKTLSGMLPICASCKKIRNDEGYWEQLEVYLRDHSSAEFSHGICPECAEKLYPDFYKPEDKKNKPGKT